MSILEFKHWQLEVESDLSKYDNFQHYLHVYRISSEIELSSIIYLCIGSLASGYCMKILSKLQEIR
jgi:hypothetical protein